MLKKLICIALCFMLCIPALAEEIVLPVLVAQLGDAAIMVEMDEQGDEYTEVLVVGEATVIMGRFSGEISAKELAVRYGDNVRDGEALLRGENGIDERCVYLSGDGENTWAIDVSVIWLDGYTYAFTVVVSENSYFGYITDEPFSAQVDWWVSTLDVFDGAPYEQTEAQTTEIMLLIDSPLYNDSELFTSEPFGEGWMSRFIYGDGEVGICEYQLPAADTAVGAGDALYAAASAIDPAAENFTWYRDDEKSDLLGFDVYRCAWGSYDSHTRALAVSGPQLLVLTASAEAACFADYEQMIIDMFDSVDVFASEAYVDVSGIVAEEIAYALLGGYDSFNYVWDEVFNDEYYCVYEFCDDVDQPIGVVAVHPDTGHAYISVGTDALNPIYEEVLIIDDTYYLPQSVGSAAIDSVRPFRF